MKAAEKAEPAKNRSRLAGGNLADQKCWSFIKEVNSSSEERLDSVAVHDGYRKYTYRQMFRHWEKYAEAFSAVGLTGKNHSRVALIGPQQTETIFAFYALNMTGASVSIIYFLDLFDEKRIRTMIEKEKITDLLIADVFAFPNVMKRLLRDRELLGLRNIILLEAPMGGEYAIPPLEAVRKLNASMFRELEGGLLMEDLLRDCEATPIAYGDKKSSDSSLILHTTGTVSGIHKPVPMSDKALNSFVVCVRDVKDTYEDFKAAPEHMVTFLALNMSWVYVMVDMLHTAFGLGMELVCLPFGVTNPNYADAIVNYGINIMFTSLAFLDTWNKTMPDIDLSKVKIVFMGGTYVSPEIKKNFNDYLRSCGSPARIINGYGLSEMGGACIIAPSGRDDDAIGYPLPGYKVKIFSEDEEKFYDLSDGPRTGVLHLSSPTMSTGRLDDTVFFELTRIDGDDYFNSNDLVRVNEDGSMTCIGRSNQYFVTNTGIRFDAGLVENAVTSQPGIAACGIAPEFHKIIHDNVPVLYVETSSQGSDRLGTVRNALIQVFITDGKLADSNLPSQCILVEKIPLNSGGKVDAKRLASGMVEGKRYDVQPVKLNDKIVDILLLPASDNEISSTGAIPEELENDPYNILAEIFAAIPEIKTKGFSRVLRIPGIRDLVLKLTDFDLNNIPVSMSKMAPKLMKLSVDQIPMPRTTGDNKQGDPKNWMKNFVSMLESMKAPEFPALVPPVPFMPPLAPLPLMPVWGWSGKKSAAKSDRKTQQEDLKNGVETGMEWMRDAQKVSLDACREQWDKTFPKYMDLQESIAASLPDEEPSLPGMPSFGISPRAFMEKMNEFQKNANKFAREQAESFLEFCQQGQQRAKSVISDAVDHIEGDAKEPSDSASEKTDGE